MNGIRKHNQDLFLHALIIGMFFTMFALFNGHPEMDTSLSVPSAIHEHHQSTSSIIPLLPEIPEYSEVWSISKPEFQLLGMDNPFAKAILAARVGQRLGICEQLYSSIKPFTHFMLSTQIFSSIPEEATA